MPGGGGIAEQVEVIHAVVDGAPAVRERAVTHNFRGGEYERLKYRGGRPNQARRAGEKRMQPRNVRAEPPLVAVDQRTTQAVAQPLHGSIVGKPRSRTATSRRAPKRRGGA